MTMAEYIKREATIKAIVDSRNRYYNSASNQYLVGRCDGLDIAAGLLRVAPTVDAVVVTRCKDCRSYNKPKTGWCEVHLDRVQPDDFCSYGGRKDGGDG